MKKTTGGLVTLLAFLSLALSPASFGRQQPDQQFNVNVPNPAYPKKHPKVLFDEAHFNAHTTVGTYKAFAGLLLNDGYQVIPNKQGFSKQSLKGYDVLIVVNATSSKPHSGAPAFTEQECDAIRDWVQAGGALLLVVDHPPFGAAAALLARRFDVDISPGYAVDKVNYNKEAEDQSEIVFTRENRLLADHPITQGRGGTEQVDKVITFGGASLKGPEGSAAILKLGDTASDVLRPDDKPAPPDAAPRDYKVTPAAGRSQAIALEFGKGRVVVFGEAAALTAQVGARDLRYGMNVSGTDNRQLALNIMHWLSGLLK